MSVAAGTATDAAGNLNNTQTISIIVDTTAPSTIELYNLSNNTNTTDTTPTFVWEVNDSMTQISSCDLIINDVINQSFTNVTNGTTFNHTLTTPLIGATYNWSVSCNDSVLITNTSQTRILNIDLIPPNVTIHAPLSNPTINVSQTIEIAVNVTDDTAIGTSIANITLPNSTITQLTLTKATGTTTYNNSYTTPNIQGQFNITFVVNDTLGNTNNSQNTTFTINSGDADSDGLPDEIDYILGNESNVTTSANITLNITLNSGSINQSLNQIQEIVFYNVTTPIMNFTHNFSASVLNLSRISIITFNQTSVLVNVSDQLASGESKTLYIADAGFNALCVKDEDIESMDNMTSTCTGSNETDFTTCLADSSGTTIGSLTCYDEGSIIRVEGLNNSALRGTLGALPSNNQGGSSGGGSGGGGSGSSSSSTSNPSQNQVSVSQGPSNQEDSPPPRQKEQEQEQEQEHREELRQEQIEEMSESGDNQAEKNSVNLFGHAIFDSKTSFKFDKSVYKPIKEMVLLMIVTIIIFAMVKRRIDKEDKKGKSKAQKIKVHGMFGKRHFGTKKSKLHYLKNYQEKRKVKLIKLKKTNYRKIFVKLIKKKKSNTYTKKIKTKQKTKKIKRRFFLFKNRRKK